MNHSVGIFRFGPELNYNPEIKNLKIIESLDQLYDIQYDNIIIIFTKLEELNEINIQQIKCSRLFIIIKSDDSIPNLRERFYEHIPYVNRRFLYTLNYLHPADLLFEHIKNNLLIESISFFRKSYVFLVENFSCFFIKRSDIKYVTI